MVFSKKIKEDTKELINDVEDVVEDVEELKEDVDNVVESIEEIKENAVEIINDVAEHLGLSEKEEEDRLKKYYQNLENVKDSVWGEGIYNCINHSMENKTLDVVIEELSNKVLYSVKEQGDEYKHLTKIAKNMVFDLNNQISIGKNTKELYKKTETNKFGKSNYIIMKMKIKEPSKYGFILCQNKNRIMQVKYCILKPLNKKAVDECNKFMNPQVKNIIKKLKKHSK